MEQVGCRGPALVTGASGGLGAALARRLAAGGYEVWLAARRVPQLEAVASDIRSSGGRAHVLELDVADHGASRARLARLERDCGGMELIVVNAAVAGMRAARPFASAPWENTLELLQTNLVGAAACIEPFLPGMLARGRGQVVGISSAMADIPSPLAPVYGASKAGLSFLLRSIDLETRPRGVAMTVVQPGFIRTDAVAGIPFRLPLVVEAEDAAALIERAILRRARVVCFPRSLTAILRLLAALPSPVAQWLFQRSVRSDAGRRLRAAAARA